MKIALCSVTDSGVVRVRSELIKELIKNGDSVVVITPESKYRGEIEGMGCSFFNIDIDAHGKNPLKDYFLYRKYISLLKRVKPDIVLTFTTKPNIFCNMACKKLKIPSIVNITGLGKAFDSKGLLPSIMIKLYRKAFNSEYIKKVFFQNDQSKSFFVSKGIGNPSCFERIPGSGVNLEKYQVLPYPADDEDIHFLFVARIMKEKGILNYIEAARTIREKNQNIYFHVLGNCEKSLLDLIQKENCNQTIIYHGQVNNVLDFQRISCCTIQPSYYPEGMSNVILEAAACARPVITTNHPGCKEGVEDGKTGFVFEPRNTTSLVLAIERFLSMSNEERAKMGLAGRQKMETEYDRSIVVKAYVSGINKIFRL